MLGIFLDTETNGLNPHRHSLLELAFKVIDVSTSQQKASYTSIIKQAPEVWKKSDPDSLKINGFTWDQILQGQESHLVAEEIIACFTELQISRYSAVFICQNPSFDRAFFSQLIDPDIQESLNWPYHWLDLASMYWAIKIQTKKPPFPWNTGVSKDRIASVYELAPEDKPHRAMNGVNHLLLCYEAIVGFPSRI